MLIGLAIFVDKIFVIHLHLTKSRNYDLENLELYGIIIKYTTYQTVNQDTFRNESSNSFFAKPPSIASLQAGKKKERLNYTVMLFRAVASTPASPVLAGPLFS